MRARVSYEWFVSEDYDGELHMGEVDDPMVDCEVSARSLLDVVFPLPTDVVPNLSEPSRSLV